MLKPNASEFIVSIRFAIKPSPLPSKDNKMQDLQSNLRHYLPRITKCKICNQTFAITFQDAIMTLISVKSSSEVDF
jgi:hypothetical protein